MPNFEGVGASGDEPQDVRRLEKPIDRAEVFDSILAGAVDAVGLELRNREDFLEGRSRFLYGFTEKTDSRKGFIKAARLEDKKVCENLKRESGVLHAVRQLNIPSVDQYVPYKEIPEGYAVFELERLDTDKGELLATPELIATANPEYGAWAATTLIKTTGKEIPHGVELGIFKRDERNNSQDSFWRMWQEADLSVLGCPQDDRNWVSDSEYANLRSLFDETKTVLSVMVEKGEKSDVWYFVHNDTAPNNTFFNIENKDALLLDFEHGGITHNLTLAKLVDYGNFYARAWSNAAMQKKFIGKLLSEASPENFKETYEFIKGMVVYGTFYLAKYAMNPEHPEHIMAFKLIKNLPDNLAFLDLLYNNTKDSV